MASRLTGPSHWAIAGLLLLAALISLSAGCGAVGAPIPPESYGVAAQQAREREREAQAKGRPVPPAAPEVTPKEPKPEEEEILPELRPIGSR
ncbi:hypothetical protein [Nitrospira sp. Kam-Ns4a]